MLQAKQANLVRFYRGRSCASRRNSVNKGRLESAVGLASLLKSRLVSERTKIDGMSSSSMIARQSSSGRDARRESSVMLLTVDILQRA